MAKNPIIFIKNIKPKNLIYPAVSVALSIFLIVAFYFIIRFLSDSFDQAFKTDPFLIQRETIRFNLKELEPVIKKLKIQI